MYTFIVSISNGYILHTVMHLISNDCYIELIVFILVKSMVVQILDNNIHI